MYYSYLSSNVSKVHLNGGFTKHFTESFKIKVEDILSPDIHATSVVIGVPRKLTEQPEILGSVFYCENVTELTL